MVLLNVDIPCSMNRCIVELVDGSGDCRPEAIDLETPGVIWCMITCGVAQQYHSYQPVTIEQPINITDHQSTEVDLNNRAYWLSRFKLPDKPWFRLVGSDSPSLILTSLDCRSTLRAPLADLPWVPVPPQRPRPQLYSFNLVHTSISAIRRYLILIYIYPKKFNTSHGQFPEFCIFGAWF